MNILRTVLASLAIVLFVFALLRECEDGRRRKWWAVVLLVLTELAVIWALLRTTAGWATVLLAALVIGTLIFLLRRRLRLVLVPVLALAMFLGAWATGGVAVANASGVCPKKDDVQLVAVHYPAGDSQAGKTVTSHGKPACGYCPIKGQTQIADAKTHKVEVQIKGKTKGQAVCETATPPTTPSTTTPPSGSKKGKPVSKTPGQLLAAANSMAKHQHMQFGAKSSSNPNGVDCADGCVLFGGLEGSTPATVLQDLEAKLTRSPRAADFLAREVVQLQKRHYTDARSVGNPAKFEHDLRIVFGFISGSTPSLEITPKGAVVWNTVNLPDGTLVQFQQTLSKDRETLVLRKHGMELRVFTTCGNGISVIQVPNVPTTTSPPPQREFPPGPPTTPPVTTTTIKCANHPFPQRCGDGGTGIDKTPTQQAKKKPTKGYPGQYNQTVKAHKPPTDPYKPNPTSGANPPKGQKSPPGAGSSTDQTGSSGGIDYNPGPSPGPTVSTTPPNNCLDNPKGCGTGT